MADKFANIAALTEFLSKIKAWANAQFATKATASTSSNGLMSSSDKTKLNGVATGATNVVESTVSGWGFTKNSGTVTGIKMNGASKGTSGVVDLGTVITAHQDISGKQDKITAITAQTTQAVYPIKIDSQGHITAYGSAVTIPSEVTESTVSGWGFTKNTGTVTSVKAGSGLATADDKADSDTKGSITTSGTLYLTKSGATAGSYGPSVNASPAYGGNFKVPYVTVDKYGRVTAAADKTITLPASDNTDHRKSFYATCSTAANAQKKVATLANSDGWELKAGTVVGVKFTNTNTYDSTAAAPVTLNVNNTGDKPIYYNNAASPTGTNTAIYGYANRIIYYMYDGTNWCWLSDGRHDGNSDTKVRQTLKTDNVNRPLLMAYSDTSVTTGNVDNVAYRNNSIYANASTGNIQATKLNGVDIGSSPKFTDTTYSAEKGISLSSGKFGHSNTAITAQTTQAVYPIKIDAYGHITAYGSAVTIPAAVRVKGNSESSYRTGDVNLTAANIGAAASSHTHGNIQNGGTLQTNDITIASGDKLVVTDSSDSSKIARSSISFDGSTTTQFLSKKGTFETPTVSVTITENTTFNISGTTFKIELVS